MPPLPQPNDEQEEAVEQEAPAGSPSSPAPPAAPAQQPAADAWGGPSREEWQTIVRGMGQLAERGLFDEPQQQGEQPDLDNMDLGEAISYYMDGRIGEISPYIEAAAAREGRERMNEIFDEIEKRPEMGEFDRKLAEKLAQAAFAENPDPRYAQQATITGAQMAAEFQKNFGEQAVKKFRASYRTRGPGSAEELPGSGGESSEWTPKGKSADEIIEHWAGQEPVG